MSINKGLHWLAMAILGMLLMGLIGLVGALLYLLALNVAEHWSGWVWFLGIVSVLILTQWACRVIENHGFPWRPTTKFDSPDKGL